MRVEAASHTPIAAMHRGQLRDQTLLCLKRGRRANPDVLLVRAEGGLVVVKDFSKRPGLVRWLIGRGSLRREARALERLAETGIAPRVLGWVDAFALVIEHRPGTQLSRRRPHTFSPGFVAELWAALRAMHSRGVVHLDLGHRSNIRCDADGRPVLIDFASALTLPPDAAWARAILAVTRVVDTRAFRKWERWLREAAPPSPDPLVQRPGGSEANGSSGGESAGGRMASRPM